MFRSQQFVISLVVLIAVGAFSTAQSSADKSWELGPFIHSATDSPVISPNAASVFQDAIRNAPVHWEALHTFNPAAVVRGDKVYVLYRAEDDSGEMLIGGHTSRLGLAVSTDGVHFTRQAEPVFFPAEDAQKSREWPGGVEDPRIVEAEDGTYVLTYTQWNRETYSVGVATSTDLEHWTKHGPAFLNAKSGKYAALKYKSAGIVTSLRNGRLIATRIRGQYWMYWGEGSVHLATSPDLIQWTPMEDSTGKLIEVLKPCPGHFDSGFPETGPPPVLTNQGIIVIYNGKNSPTEGDPKLATNTYAAGEALFDSHDPERLLKRSDVPVLQPLLPFEKSGQYAAGTTFAEGLVYFHSHWFLYYGCADSLVGVVQAQ